MKENLKLAIQKKGRLSSDVTTLLRSIGLNFEQYGSSTSLISKVKNFDLEMLYLRDDDIPEYVQDEVCDIGIAGLNVIQEKQANVKVLRNLGFSSCRLCIAASPLSKINNIRDLEGKKIATSHPNILKKFLRENKINSKIITLSGSVEIAPALDIADCICDLVSSGSTLKFNGLEEVLTIMSSEAVLISNKSKISSRKQELLDSFLSRIEGRLTASKNKYIMLNANESLLPEIRNILPGLKSPTVIPLAEKGMIAVHSVAPEDKIWEITENLKKIGASGILVIPIETMLI